MGGIKVTLTIDDALYSELNKMAKEEGFGRISTLARHLIVTSIKASGETADCRVVKVPVENYRELAAFVKGKSLGSIATLACYTMGLHMAKYPLSKAQKERVGKSVGE